MQTRRGDDSGAAGGRDGDAAGGLGGGLLRREPTAAESGAALGAAVELLPDDLRESYAQVRREPGGALVRACRWLAVVAAYALAGAALYYAMDALYFGEARLRCEGDLMDQSRHWIETFIGAQ